MHRAGQTSTWQHINKAISLETNVILLYNKWYFYAGSESIPLSKSGQFVSLSSSYSTLEPSGESEAPTKFSFAAQQEHRPPKHAILHLKKHSFVSQARLLLLAAALGAFRGCDGDGTRRLVGTAFGCAGFRAICTAVAGRLHEYNSKHRSTYDFNLGSWLDAVGKSLLQMQF